MYGNIKKSNPITFQVGGSNSSVKNLPIFVQNSLFGIASHLWSPNIVDHVNKTLFFGLT